MKNNLTILAPAKINIFLDVLGKRDDGFHDISSVMQTIGIFDRLRVTVNDAAQGECVIAVECGGDALNNEKNIVYAAAKAFFASANIDSYNVSFDIEKRIPMMAGLGGGSSDAAAALLALNMLYETELGVDKLAEIGASVGSDVPFCVKRGTVSVSGRGEIMKDAPPMPDCFIVVAMPNEEKISTKEAYSKIDAISVIAPVSDIENALSECDVEKTGKSLFNKFEYILPSESKSLALKRAFLDLGAYGALLCGSGSAVFGLFSSVAEAKAAAEKLSGEAETFVCTPIRRNTSLIEE